MADSWADFGGPPSQSAPAPALVAAGAPAVAAQDGWAAFGGAPDTQPEQNAPVQPAAKTGMAANIGAGMVEGGAGVINTASDPFGNLIGKPLATLMVTGHDASTSPAEAGFEVTTAGGCDRLQIGQPEPRSTTV